jgi:predicted glycoside hydrolase/deacetylase ChbG (UPF0249 family)
MAGDRYLIVNADDFGQSHGVNRGVIEAHEHGIVTSASLMVRWPAAAEAADYSRSHPQLSLGLHIDLCEWAYRDETWIPLYEVVPPDNLAAIADEVSRQLEMFHDLVGRFPTHLDSHQHVHRSEPVCSVLIETAGKLRVPLRDYDPEIHYCGEFYGQTGKGEPFPDAITVEGLIRVFAALPTGITEMGCHPGLEIDFESMYRSEREEELKVLCDSRLRAVIAAQGIQLRSFNDVTSHSAANQTESEMSGLEI